MYTRAICKSLEHSLFHGKTIVVYGARQTGKTTLMKTLLQHNSNIPHLYLDGEDRNIQTQISKQEINYFISYFGKEKKIVIIDEAQKIANIGINLKLIHDHLPRIQVIAT
jgi:predicted AAA+ superfamily ATPase